MAASAIARGRSTPLVSGFVKEHSLDEMTRKYEVSVRTSRGGATVVGGGTPIGEGRCGQVMMVRRRDTGEPFAMKVITMSSMDAGRFDELRSEIQVQKRLDHPNIAKIIECFSDADQGRMYIVMELCTGGSLVQRLEQSHQLLDEATCATVIEKVLSAIHYCHGHGVVHRDIKLDNIMHESEATDAEPKLIDFGYACELDLLPDGAIMWEQLGTPSYMAPELWKKRAERRYDAKVDMWALGVAAYMLLSRSRPWHHADLDEKKKMIQHKPLRFTSSAWSGRSTEAIDLISWLLQKNVDERPTPSEALAHPWFQQRSSVHAGPDAAHELQRRSTIVDSLEAFSAADGISKIALEVVAFTMPPARLDELRQVFRKMDIDGSGTLSLSEFKQAMALQPELPPERVEQMFAQMDVAHHGEVDYTEFLAAAVAGSSCLADGECSVRLKHAFRVLDSQRKGYIDADDVRAACGDSFSEKSARVMITQCSANGGGHRDRIDYPHFCAAVRRSFPMLPRTSKKQPFLSRWLSRARARLLTIKRVAPTGRPSIRRSHSGGSLPLLDRPRGVQRQRSSGGRLVLAALD